jgi:hypothetical protein
VAEHDHRVAVLDPLVGLDAELVPVVRDVLEHLLDRVLALVRAAAR